MYMRYENWHEVDGNILGHMTRNKHISHMRKSIPLLQFSVIAHKLSFSTATTAAATTTQDRQRFFQIFSFFPQFFLWKINTNNNNNTEMAREKSNAVIFRFIVLISSKLSYAHDF